MILLYLILFMMILLSMTMLAVPFIKNSSQLMVYCILSITTLALSMVFYQLIGNPSGLRAWLTQGQTHYRLEMQIKQLGGIDHIIQNIQKKLASNPNDKKGWIILGKLYLGIQDYDSAKKCFEKAKAL